VVTGSVSEQKKRIQAAEGEAISPPTAASGLHATRYLLLEQLLP
jgi:hypothetical protein